MEEIPAGRNVRCCFCKTSESNEILYGKLYRLKNVSTHYFCMLLSAQIAQNGEDHEGILGFLPCDIITEVNRGQNLVCSYCKTSGATLQCAHRRCRKIFHLPCGRKRLSLHQFFDNFKTYCGKHRPKQKINAKVLAATRNTQANCMICFDTVVNASPQTLWAPCCSKNSWFHWECVQRLALSAGYFFKCPLCNNKKEFTQAMQQMGIYVPEQDASWELEPNAYQNLLERHDSCDATVCLCPRGRKYFVQHSKWEIQLCVACGSQGMHVGCGGSKNGRSWQCPLCSAVIKKDGNADTTPCIPSTPTPAPVAVAATSAVAEMLPEEPRRLRSSLYGRPVDTPSGVRVTRRGRIPINNSRVESSSIEPASRQAVPPDPICRAVPPEPICRPSVQAKEEHKVIVVEDTDEIIDVESSDSEIEILQTCEKRLKDYNGQVLAVTNIKAQGNPREYVLGQDLGQIASDESADTEALRAPEFVPVAEEPYDEPAPESALKPAPEFADSEIEIIEESLPQSSGRPSVSRSVQRIGPLQSIERRNWSLSRQNPEGNKRRRTKEPEIVIDVEREISESSLVQQPHPPRSERPGQQLFEDQKTSQIEFSPGPDIILESEWPQSDVRRRNKQQHNQVWPNQVRILDIGTINVSDLITNS